MNKNINDIVAGLTIEAPECDIEQLSIAIIKKCADLEDSWGDSGAYTTFGQRLKAHFGIHDTNT